MKPKIAVVLLFFFLIRLYGIVYPPIETIHNWRQATVVMVARNFYELDPNPLYPRVDFAGDKSGITPMEAPILNYLIYLAALLFGYDHWYGRLINLLITTLGAYYFYRLLCYCFHERWAWLATVFLSASVWFIYGRKIMPDTFATSLAIIAFYFAFRYFNENRLQFLLYYTLLGSLAILAKIPVGYLWFAFLPYLWKHYPWRSIHYYWSVATLFIIAIVGWWYFYWCPYLLQQFQFEHFFLGKSIAMGFQELLQDPQNLIRQFAERTLKISGFFLFLWGIIQLLKQRKWFILITFLALCFGFSFIMLKGGKTFLVHRYYMVPFAPVMAWIAAYPLTQIKRRWAVVLVAVVVLEGTVGDIHDFYTYPHQWALVHLEDSLKRLPCQGRIAINSAPNPTPMYFAHKKGWLITNTSIALSRVQDSLYKRGCSCVVILRRYLGQDTLLSLPLLQQTPYWRIYRLVPLRQFSKNNFQR